MIHIMSIVVVVLLIVINHFDRKDIKSLRTLGESKDRYIAALEKRLRNERMYKK